uniref:Beta-galactosidase n=1 Tax=Esox lucius TaxID=8010 RepID=A0A3P9A8X9_ESOLU
MVVLRIRNAHKRHALLCLSIIGFIVYWYLTHKSISHAPLLSSTMPGGRRMGRRGGLSANSSQFTLEGEPFRILGGSVHYFRVPRAYWRDRLMKMKACGINTLTTYVPWSLHQPERGVFHFHTELDLEAYINLAAEIGLWVILRPGPYICSELDLGGLPSWLLRDRSMRLRTTHLGFTEAVNQFFDKLIPKVVPLQYKKGGPIIAIQLENEYGSFAMDSTYMPFIKEALQSRGINELLLTSDNQKGLLKGGGVSGALRTLNLQKLNLGDIKDLNAIQPKSPMMVMEYWTGWFDAWGDLHHVLSPEGRVISFHGISINLYMFHGGTNFGFMSGALANPVYKALITSYDYDAPLSESGEYTLSLRWKYFLKRISVQSALPDMPALRWKETYEPAIMYQHLSLWDVLSFTEEPFKSPIPVNMENLPVNNGNGQSSGYTLYETTITNGGSLKSGDNVRDRALVFVDRHYIGIFKHRSLELMTLSLLVENCGRVHYGKDLDKQRKGLVGDILLNNAPLRDFTIYSLDMKTSFIDRFSLPHSPSFPGFFLGRMFTYGYPSDTFIKLPGWGKGVVFINGLNLGRYWSIGPQQTLYLPGPFLNSGVNQVIVFEEQEADYKITFEEAPDLGMAVDIQ